MPSALSWLDFAESDRQRALQVIDLFREKSTVDELGFSPIRDAFADRLFPGTSTIQTRARYFLFVPWIMRRNEGKKYSVQDIATRVRKRETELIRALLEGDQEQGGIIGREALGTLKRMPSSVYWRGLHLWGIRLFSGSIDQYIRKLAAGGETRAGVVTDDGEPLSQSTRNWHPGLPSEPADLFERTTFDLTRPEAEFLRDRVCHHQPRSMLAQIMMRAGGTLDAAYAWDASLTDLLTQDVREVVEHGRRFALCAWGGPLVYSRMLAGMKRNDELLAALDLGLAEWRDALGAADADLAGWDRVVFWELVQKLNPRLSSRTRAFADQWIDLSLRAAAGRQVWHDADVLKLIEAREGQLKGGRARLRPENQRGRDRWQGDPGGGPMDYRWGSTRVIVNDILAGLQGGRSEEASHA